MSITVSSHRALTLALVVAWLLTGCGSGTGAGSSTASGPSSAKAPAPVETEPVRIGPLTLRRTFSGTLEPATRVEIAARVGGRIEEMAVDLGDLIERGQLVARIDAAELDAAMLQAEADLAVARASVTEARAAAEFSGRVLERRLALDKDGVASKAELDSARAESSAREASVAVAIARVKRAEAALNIAQLRRSEADVVASWVEEEAPMLANEDTAVLTEADVADDDLADDFEGEAVAAAVTASGSVRAVAQRYVDEGELIQAGTPLVRVVGLDPIVAVVFVPERDYARLVTGARAELVTDAYPDERFDGVVSRVAPTFSLNTRQVRVELRIDNSSLRLKPGMFVRATLELARQESAVIVPYEALTRRDGVDGLFMVEGGTPSLARWLPVRQGIRDGDAVAVHPVGGGDWSRPPAAGTPVVTLGQELCDDGSLVNVPPIPEGATVTGTSVVPR